MIIIVAPYSSIEDFASPHLGAARKIELIVGLLSQIDKNITLINSAHTGPINAKPAVAYADVGGVIVRVITPPIYKSRMLGKLINIFQVQSVLSLIPNTEKPNLLWIYNGYAFEMNFVRYFDKIYSAKKILEFEDWHFARNRWLNPKPFIDYLFWRVVVRRFSSATAVNMRLVNFLKKYIDEVILLPGLVPNKLVAIADSNPPFKTPNDSITVGYFGGLTREKGADFLLTLAERNHSNAIFLITGSGELEDQFISLSKSLRDRFIFLGLVNETDLYRLIAKCDVVINPHKCNDGLKSGIFPFKLVEAVASGRLVISTHASCDGMSKIFEGVLFVDDNLESIEFAIESAFDFYSNHSAKVKDGASAARAEFGADSFLRFVKSQMLL